MSYRGVWKEAPKVGDKVFCIEKTHNRLKYGKVYTVIRREDNECIGVELDDGTTGGFYWKRFVPYSKEAGCAICKSSCKKDKPCNLIDSIIKEGV